MRLLKYLLKRLGAYFLRGLLVLLPIGLTIFLILSAIRYVAGWLDHTPANFDIPGIGFLIVITTITLVGILFSGIIGRTMLGWLDELMSRTPLVKIIYSSIKDLLEAFVGDKKKFTEPVTVQVSSEGIKLVGFVTRKDLAALGMPGMVSVYLPLSYSLTGHIILSPADKVSPLDANPADVMKFVVSGGVTGINE